MADIEHEFISACIVQSDLTQALVARISEDWFQDPDHARVWELVLKHYRRYDEVPPYTVIHTAFPTYRLARIENKIDWYVDQMRNSHLHAGLVEALAATQDLIKERKPREAYADLLASLQGMAPDMDSMADLELTGTWEDRLDYYDDLKRHKGQLRGYTTGFPSLDRCTMGLQPGQFIVAAGLPKAGKSTLLLAFAVALHDSRKRPLFIGFEMSNSETSARYDAQVAKVNFQRMLTGELSREEERRLVEAGSKRANHPDFILSADVFSTTTVSGVAAKIDQHKPNVVYIDGLYLMDDELGEPKGSPAALRNITQGLKRLAQVKNVCIVGTTQVNANKVTKSGGVQSVSLYGSQSFAQDCDVMVAVEATDDYEVQKLKLLLNRNGPNAEVLVLWDWTMGQFEELDADSA